MVGTLCSGDGLFRDASWGDGLWRGHFVEGRFVEAPIKISREKKCTRFCIKHYNKCNIIKGVASTPSLNRLHCYDPTKAFKNR